MALDHRCKECFERNFERLIIRSPLTTAQVPEFSAFFNHLVNNCAQLTSPEIQREFQNKLAEMNGIEDPYRDEKRNSNQLALELYGEWKPKVLASDNPYQLALRLALAGNVMDYGANQQFDIHKSIEDALSAPIAIDHSVLLRERIRQSGKILFLGDNAGEIVFDKLLIETIMHPNITYVVKGGPAINDATMEDSEATGMEWVADVISNGYDAPSTVLSKSDPEFRSHFESADLIISKGQGNFEGLMSARDPRIFFLLMVKCDYISEKIGVPKGSFVVIDYEKE
ncbi:MAG TPA: hypothetical protein DC042_08045 [Bacteroidales bacterium]|nr:hypothetical protein [Bacteroidales bacterium]